MEQQVTTGTLLREVARLHTHLQRTNVVCCAGTTVTQWAGSPGRTQSAHWLRQELDEPSRLAPGARRPDRKSARQTDHRMVRLSLTALGERLLRELNGTLNGLSERVPASEHEGVQKALSLLLVALQAEVERSSLPADTSGGLEQGDGGGAARCTCD